MSSETNPTKVRVDAGEDDEAIDAWAEGMSQALGSLIREGYLRWVKEPTDLRTQTTVPLISEIMQVTEKGYSTYSRVRKAFQEADVGDLSKLSNSEFTRLLSFWAQEHDLVPGLDGYETYGLLAWTAHLMAEEEALRRPDGARRQFIGALTEESIQALTNG